MSNLTAPPGAEEVTDKDSEKMRPAWLRWLNNLWASMPRFVTLTHDFGSVSAQSQDTTTVTVTGAQIGDCVIVRPTTAVNGIILDGTVTSAETVTVRAVNYSAAPINPGSQVYRVMVFQQ